MNIKLSTFSVNAIFCFCFGFSILISGVNGEGCRTPKKKLGRCIELENCPSLIQLSQQKPLPIDNIYYLMLSRCDDIGSKVCCDADGNEVWQPSLGSRVGTDSGVCTTVEGGKGECVLIANCPELRRLLDVRPFTTAKAEYLNKACCGFEGVTPKVCCPRDDDNKANKPLERSMDVPLAPIVSPFLPDTDTCGPYTLNRIIGGTVAEIDEFPWMALLGYKTPNGNTFNCGGTLISNRYVLTAAHCVSQEFLATKNFTLLVVRLGEYDVENVTDCTYMEGIRTCNDPVIDVGIAEKTVHENYLPHDISQQHDIALLRLARKISFTDYIKPICIPTTPDLLSKTYIGSSMTVAGWGETGSSSQSNILLKVDVRVKPILDCKLMYGGKRDLGSGQLCAGGDSSMDSCRGDSGGPLMVMDGTAGRVNLYIAGVVSYGPSKCGLYNWPGVYTRVSQYVPWIVSKLKP